MGEVFLAQDSRLGRQVALKAVTPAWAAHPEARQRLLQEARAAAALSHQGIAAIHDVLETQAGTFIVMEYVEGTPLDEVVAQGPLPIRRVLQIGLELTDALAAAHALGIVHRDIKPGNVRLTPAGHAKVLDFGLARTLDGADHGQSGADAPTAPITQADQVVGTPAYMAPEQLRGSRGDRASDIYGLGVVLFELLTGRRPFAAGSLFELGAEALTKGVPDARTLRPDVPADLAAVVARATAREPRDRIASVQEMHDLLQNVYAAHFTPSPVVPQSPLGPAVPAPPTALATTRLRLRTGGWVAVAALGVIATAVLLTRLGGPGPQARRTSVVAVLPVSAPEGSAELESAAAGIGELLTANLAAVPGVQVLPRGETAAARGAGLDLARLIRELAPNYVVNAAVDGSPSGYRLDVRLVDNTGAVSWQRRYEGRTDDPFELPAQVSADVGRAMAEAGAVSAEALAVAAGRFQKAPTASRDAWAHYTDAVRFLERPDIAGNVARATTLLEEAVRRDPQFALAWAALGTACSVQYEETKDERWPARAQQANLEALRLDPNRAETRIALAQMYESTGARERAIEEYGRARALAPDSDAPPRLLGGLYADMGRYDESISALEAAIALRPTYWRNWSFLGYTHFKAGRHAEAAAAYERLLALQPDSARGHSALGTVLSELGRIAEAREHYRRAVDLGPSSAAWSNLGTLDFFDGRYADAVRAYEQAIALSPRDPVYHRNLGDANLASGRRPEARRAYAASLALLEQQLDTNARDAGAISLRAVVEAKLGRSENARRLSAEALALLPDDKDVIYHACVVAALAGRPDEAAGLLTRALDRGYNAGFAGRDPDLAQLRRVPAVRERLASGAIAP